MHADLKADLQRRVSTIGIQILNFTFTDIVYSEEVEKMFLARQEAKAHVRARDIVAEGVSDTVIKTLERLQKNGKIEFDSSAKAQVATNLLLVLTNNDNGNVNLFINNSAIPAYQEK